ncbi:MAG TPA: TlpA disulfide reductase family protein [Steroidobacteraceae bacterium]|nr:TlpA disulfide reductase family protein [Steroidobacteraceae bacterium]
MTDRGLRLAGIALLAMVAFWAGTRIYLHMAGRLGVVNVPVGEARVPAPGDLADSPLPRVVRIPDRLPDFSLQGLDGKPTSISEWRGKSLLINFWATWCAPCRREIPLLEGLSADWAARGVTVIGIAVDQREEVLTYADDLKIHYPLLIGEQDALDVAGTFGVESPVFPFTVFTDKRGEVVALFLGELHRAQADLILATVADLDQDRVALKQARRRIAEGLDTLAPATPL